MNLTRRDSSELIPGAAFAFPMLGTGENNSPAAGATSLCH
jgi:hypothetical protein